MPKVQTIREEFLSLLKEIKDSQQLKNLEIQFLGKKGKINQLFAILRKLPPQERKNFGQEINLLKREIEKAIEQKFRSLKKKEISKKLARERIDITQPGKVPEVGSLHPLTLVQKEIVDIFSRMGFEVAEGPELETEWYNFDALNIPPDHPAREMQDTLWVKRQSSDARKNFLMRTHTSPVQVRYMLEHKPPLRIIVPGRVFRNERTDASHDCQFYQCEGLMIDKDISVANFKAIVSEFLKMFFGKDIEMRLRPSFFPFTEPSFEIDMRRKNGNWIEVMGAGMVHPNVFRSSGVDSKKWQGFAFGMGMDRLAMLKYKINDIRLFYSSDLRFLKQF